MGIVSEQTTFTLDNMGRFLCNTLDEALSSAAVTVAGKPRDFDVIVIGGGTFGAVMASTLFMNDPTRSRRILVLESGPFTLPEHVQNLPFQGGTPDFRKPWDSHSALNYPGLMFTIGGRSLAWGGWSPQLLPAELTNWPQSVVTELTDRFFRLASEEIGVADTNDFIFGRLHIGLRAQLFSKLAGVTLAVPLNALPDHPAVMYYAQRFGAAAAAGGGGSTGSTIPLPELRDMLGLPSADTTPRNDLLNMMKLEAPLAVQARTEPGLFPYNKYSAVPNLIRAARIAGKEADGINEVGDSRKRLMIVPQTKVLDVITETQADNWVRVTGVRVKDRTGAIREIRLVPPAPDGSQGVVTIALGTIESTGLAKRTFQQSLAGRAADRMGSNLIAHLRSNLNIRVPVSSLSALPPADRNALQASALFVKGKKNIAGRDRFFHLQITASGLSRFGEESEAELFKKIPDIEHLEAMLRADDSHVVITIRGIGEMTPDNPDSFIRLSPTVTEDGRASAEVTMADIKGGSSTTPESEIDKEIWNAMDDLSDQVALAFANGKQFEVLMTKLGRTVVLPAGATAADLKATHPHKDRRDALGTTHHDAGTMRMGTDVATSVTNDYGRIHDTTNCYVASPAIFPAVGSPNPMLTGVALARRTAELLTTSVLPKPAVRAPAPGFTALFDGTENTFKKWRLANRKDSGQSFALLNGEMVSYGASDIALFYYSDKVFTDFHLRLQFRVFDLTNHNSGVYLRFRDPLTVMPLEIRQRAAADGAPLAANPAYSAIYSGFEVQIDDTARRDDSKEFYGLRPEPDGLYKNRTGAIYKIPAGDFVFHLGFHDAAIQQYVPGPLLRTDVWFQYDIIATGNHYEVTLTDTASGASQKTSVFDNTDVHRGHLNGVPSGLVGIQSYPNSQIAYRDIWIK